MYTADLRGSKYSPLDQINATNFSKLEVAWRFKTDNLGPRPENKLEGTPLMVKGMLYATAGTRRAVVALDAEDRRAEVDLQPATKASARRDGRRASCRAAACPTGPTARATSASSIVTTGYRLVSLNAKTGQPVAGFGKNGIVDLKEGVDDRQTGKQIDLEKGEIGLHSTPTVVGDVIIVGSSMFRKAWLRTRTTTRRAWSARSTCGPASMLWRFNTIPKPGEFGHDTWENESWACTGNTGVWTQITADPEAGIVYLPVETPTIDDYGGNRPGDNLFAESLVAVDLKTGVRKWHFQFVHHPLWDHDMSSAPLLIDATIDGKPRKVVAVPLQAGLALRASTASPASRSGRSKRRRCRRPTMPREKTSPTQPFPTKPAAYARTYDRRERPDRLHAGAARAGAREPEALPLGADAVRSADRSESKLLGAINIGNTAGGTNWPGAGFDPETGWF